MDMFIRVALYLTVTHSTCSTSSSQWKLLVYKFELVYLFSKFSSLGNVYYFPQKRLHWCFLDIVDFQGVDREASWYCLWLQKIVEIQHYCLENIGIFHFRFTNCNDWTTIFFQFKLSLTIQCTTRQSVLATV